jgi:hypothetical protein
MVSSLTDICKGFDEGSLLTLVAGPADSMLRDDLTNCRTVRASWICPDRLKTLPLISNRNRVSIALYSPLENGMY